MGPSGKKNVPGRDSSTDGASTKILEQYHEICLFVEIFTPGFFKDFEPLPSISQLVNEEVQKKQICSEAL